MFSSQHAQSIFYLEEWQLFFGVSVLKYNDII